MGTWPFPGHTETQIARTIAEAYRTQLRALAPDQCDRLDDTMRQFGQYWIAPESLVHDETSTITTAEAARLVSVRETTIWRWACTPHPHDPNRMVLPRHSRIGRRNTYLAVDVLAAARLARTHQLKRIHQPIS